MENIAPKAILMHTDFQYIGHSRPIIYDCVQSRLMLRGVQGEARIKVNGETIFMQRGLVIFAPWNATVAIQPLSDHPLMLHRVHLIPDFEGAPDYAVAHSREEQAERSGRRRDAFMPGLEGVRTAFQSRQHPVRHLTNYIFTRFHSGDWDEWQARQAGQTLLAELAKWFREESKGKRPSRFIQQAQEYLEENHYRPISTRDLARCLECSLSTVTRRFRNELKQSPTEWINRYKMDKAGQLLLSSQLRVGEVARMVGIDDPYYFSKLFRRYKQVSPLEYRRTNVDI
ncbi:MAG: helix-turn-helix transcriptional regulator [Candidatus Sumerlaeia bacterium]